MNIKFQSLSQPKSKKRINRRIVRMLLALVLLLSGMLQTASAAPGDIERVSVDSSGVEGNSFSNTPSTSSDGRFIAFWSVASNLVSGDNNDTADVFVHDRQTGITSQVSVDSNGMQGNGTSAGSSISNDGRFVAFSSLASNLVSRDGNGWSDIFVNDRQTGTTTRISVDSSGVQGNNSSSNSSISGDGWFVTFASEASNLVSGDSTYTTDIFVHDRQTGTTKMVSVHSSGIKGDTESNLPSINSNGRFVAFMPYASNLVSGDSNGESDVFVHDRQTGMTTRVSGAASIEMPCRNGAW